MAKSFKLVFKNISKKTEAIEELSSNETKRETFTQTVVKNIQPTRENFQDHSSYGAEYCTSFENTLLDLKESNSPFTFIAFFKNVRSEYSS